MAELPFQSDLVSTFFHPLPRDEKAFSSTSSKHPGKHTRPCGHTRLRGLTCRDQGYLHLEPTVVVFLSEIVWSPASGKELGQVKLSISYKNDKLFIMVMHIRGLVSVCVFVCLCLCLWLCTHYILTTTILILLAK